MKVVAVTHAVRWLVSKSEIKITHLMIVTDTAVKTGVWEGLC